MAKYVFSLFEIKERSLCLETFGHEGNERCKKDNVLIKRQTSSVMPPRKFQALLYLYEPAQIA
jgi:hypothetical protein